MWEKEILGIAPSQQAESSDILFERLSQAHQGTLLLDNMKGFSSLYHNPILELLSGREMVSPHNSKPLSVEFRLIVTLQAPLLSTDSSNEFLTQLQNRFHAITLELPALSDRMEDLPILANQLLTQLCDKHERDVPEIHPEVLRVFERHTWPDNIRELENILESILLTHTDVSMITTRHIPEGIHREAQKEPHEITFQPGMRLAELEQQAIEETLRFCGFNKEECAKTLGIGLRTLYRKLEQYKQGE